MYLIGCNICSCLFCSQFPTVVKSWGLARLLACRFEVRVFGISWTAASESNAARASYQNVANINTHLTLFSASHSDLWVTNMITTCVISNSLHLRIIKQNMKGN